MPRYFFKAEEKAAILNQIQEYVDKGWTVNNAYKQIAAEYQQEGKPMPCRQNVSKWIAAANGRNAEPANARTNTDQHGLVIPGRTDGPGEPEPEGPEGQPGETPQLDDYTNRLELIVKLYRTRSETACDAVCDRLLPELYANEEE